MATPRLAALMQGLGLHAVSDGADLTREVRWAHSTELLDPSAYLSGGELVLTLGSQFADDAACTAFVTRLADRGCVGIGLGVGDVWAAPPQALVDACTQGGLALLALPPEVPFMAVTEWLADRRAEDAVLAEHRRSVGSVIASIESGMTQPVALADELRAAGIDESRIHVIALDAGKGPLGSTAMTGTHCVIGETATHTWLLTAEPPVLPDELHPAGEADPVALSSLRSALASGASRLRGRASRLGALATITAKPEPGLVAWAVALLEPIRSSDREHGTQLEDTIRAYLDADCSVTRAARALHLHPNSVRYRLGRVRALTGEDPLTFPGQLELAIALSLSGA